MITYKSNEDFMNMKKAGKIVATIHAELQNISLPGTKIETLDKKAEEIIKKSNAVSNFLNYRGFPSYICASPNDVIVHGIPKNFVIEEGDILSIDVGCTVNGFHADAARHQRPSPVPQRPDQEHLRLQRRRRAGARRAQARARRPPIPQLSWQTNPAVEGVGAARSSSWPEKVQIHWVAARHLRRDGRCIRLGSLA